MKKKFITLAIGSLVFASVFFTGCAPASQKPEDIFSNQALPTISGLDTTPKETTTSQEPEKVSLLGLYLDDAIRVLNDYGIEKDQIDYSSDDGDIIIVKNNWTVVNQSVSNGIVHLTCSKTRSNGIIDSIEEFYEEHKDSINDIKNFVKNHDLKDILNLFS